MGPIFKSDKFYNQLKRTFYVALRKLFGRWRFYTVCAIYSHSGLNSLCKFQRF